MRDDNVRYLLAMIAILAIAVLSIVYWRLPPETDAHRLYLLFIECIPDAIVAMAVIPTVYWLFYRRGIVSMGDERHALESVSSGEEVSRKRNGFMEVIPAEVDKASHKNVGPDEVGGKTPREANGLTHVLVVVDVQEDFISGSLKAHDASSIIKPLNSAIRMAESKGMIVVFTKDWHPKDHWSFKDNGGPWNTHCVQGTPGAALSAELYKPVESVVIEFGVDPGKPGYSPLENRAFEVLLASPTVGTVYVTGIALEYCVQATCVGASEKGKRVVALEGAIATAEANPETIEKVWRDLHAIGVVREKWHGVLGDA